MKRYVTLFLLVICILASGCTVSDKQPAPPTLIAHAGGAVYGLKYTNTKEALDLSYSNGHRFIELDFERTSDNEIVLIHDWTNMAKRIFKKEGVLSEQEFLNSDTLSNLTVLDIDLLAKWMKKHSDAYIITDVKENNVDLITEIKNRYPDCFDRFIPQAYTFDEYARLNELGCKRVILTAYAIFDKTDAEIDSFAIENKPWALTVVIDKLDETRLKNLSENGVTVFAHTVNDLFIYEQYADYGLHGIYTDYFTPNGFPY